MTRRSPHLRLPAQHLRVGGDAGRATRGGLPTRSSSTPAPSPPRPSARPARRSAARAREQPRRPHHRHRLRRADRPGRWAALPGVDRVVGNADKLKPETWAAERRPPRSPTSWRRPRPPAHLVDRIRRPRPRLRPGPAGLRPPLHLLRHPLWPRPVAQRADRRHRRAGAAAGGAWLPRGGADRRRHHQLRARPAGRPEPRPDGAPAAGAGAGAAPPAAVLARPGRGGRRPLAADRDRAAADAASAPVACSMAPT